MGLLGRPGLGAALWLYLHWLQWSKSEELLIASQGPCSLQRDRACTSPAWVGSLTHMRRHTHTHTHTHARTHTHMHTHTHTAVCP